MSKKVIWITGASSGIGEATAYQYAKEGWHLILSARNEAALNQVKLACLNPEHCYVLPLDLAEQSTFREKTAEAIAAFGQIDAILHNGGISQRSLIRETSLEIDRKIMEVNFFGTVALTKELLPHFIQRQSGQFGVISSLVGKFGSPFRSSYAASKHALHGFFESLREEHYRDNIAVTMLCPGFIKTNVSKNALTADGTPLNEMDKAQENGMSAEDCAKEIYTALKAKKLEAYIGGKEKMGIYLKRFVPTLFTRILRKSEVR
ncbi:SDR family oxidoreductase [Algoriphagus halophytocola]|uniref:SDR family oxidoreductase n=1 Tax=Algoriphagus halophytocola TaxID=2991499 RepID=A0ABY6MIN2_9BACT|nr:SDR family oxidoreductase [Algoriphagus sp. TR-M5]UZD23652.1 SDR family oxidoreductase [Algoriphagus sp. TR-M5]